MYVCRNEFCLSAGTQRDQKKVLDALELALWAFYVTIGIGTQVVFLARQAFYLLSHPSNP